MISPIEQSRTRLNEFEALIAPAKVFASQRNPVVFGDLPGYVAASHMTQDSFAGNVAGGSLGC
jgi:hypothetical protein